MVTHMLGETLEQFNIFLKVSLWPLIMLMACITRNRARNDEGTKVPPSVAAATYGVAGE